MLKVYFIAGQIGHIGAIKSLHSALERHGFDVQMYDVGCMEPPGMDYVDAVIACGETTGGPSANTQMLASFLLGRKLPVLFFLATQSNLPTMFRDRTAIQCRAFCDEDSILLHLAKLAQTKKGTYKEVNISRSKDKVASQGLLARAMAALAAENSPRAAVVAKEPVPAIPPNSAVRKLPAWEMGPPGATSKQVNEGNVCLIEQYLRQGQIAHQIQEAQKANLLAQGHTVMGDCIIMPMLPEHLEYLAQVQKKGWPVFQAFSETGRFFGGDHEITLAYDGIKVIGKADGHGKLSVTLMGPDNKPYPVVDLPADVWRDITEFLRMPMLKGGTPVKPQPREGVHPAPVQGDVSNTLESAAKLMEKIFSDDANATLPKFEYPNGDNTHFNCQCCNSQYHYGTARILMTEKRCSSDKYAKRGRGLFPLYDAGMFCSVFCADEYVKKHGKLPSTRREMLLGVLAANNPPKASVSNLPLQVINEKTVYATPEDVLCPLRIENELAEGRSYEVLGFLFENVPDANSDGCVWVSANWVHNKRMLFGNVVRAAEWARDEFRKRIQTGV